MTARGCSVSWRFTTFASRNPNRWASDVRSRFRPDPLRRNQSVMTKNQLTQLFNGCVTLQKGNAVTLYFETDEQASAAFDYLSKLGNAVLVEPEMSERA